MAKVRSPNYPRLTLGEAIDRVKVVFAQEHRHAVDKAVVAQAIGYASMHGTAMAAVSAMIKYGLLEPVGEQLRVTTLGQDLSVHDPSDPEWTEAVRTAALTPALWRELHDMYGDELPSDNAIRAYLVKKGFNQNTVADVIKGYRETVEFVANVAPSAPSSPSKVADAAPEKIAMPSARPLVQQQGLADSTLKDRDAGYLELWFKLSQESEVRLVFEGRVTQHSIKKLMQLLEVSLDTFPENADNTSDGDATSR